MLQIINDYWVYFLIGQYPNGPLGGLVLTLLLASCGLVLALPLGIVLGLARVSPWRWLRWPVTGFVFVVRGLPLLMVIFWAYFFLPSVTGVKTDQFTTMLIARASTRSNMRLTCATNSTRAKAACWAWPWTSTTCGGIRSCSSRLRAQAASGFWRTTSAIGSRLRAIC